MDEKRTDLRAVFRELAAEDPGDAGPHVGLKRLIAYRQGMLAAAEREAVQEHLSLCTRCTGLLRELRDFEAAAAGEGAAGSESLKAEAWERLVRRLPPRAPAVRPIASVAGPPEAPPLPRPVLPRFAYGLAAALLLAIAGLYGWAAVTVRQERQRLARLEQRLEEREEALTAARRSLMEIERQLQAARRRIQSLEQERTDHGEAGGRVKQLEARIAELTAALEKLHRIPRAPQGQDRLAAALPDVEVSVAPRFALRGQGSPASGFLRAEGAVNLVQKSSQDRFTVAVNLADHPVYGEYRFELMDREGKVLWVGRRPGKSLLGDAGTSVSIRGLGPGLYRLRIEGLHPNRTELFGEYLLEVR